MRFRVIIAIIFTYLLQCVNLSYAQSQPTAQQLFDNGNYEAAADLFAKELKKTPNSGMINYYYGVCLYELGQYNECIEYLTKAVSRKVINAGFFLGETYMQLYRFEEAVDAFTAYIEILEKNEREISAETLVKLSSAQLGMKMIKGVERVQVIDSIMVDSLTFINYYKLSSQSGKIVGTKSLPQPLSSDSNYIAFLPQRENIIYSSIYANGNYDLVTSNKLLGSGWSEWHSLSDVINTPDNQAYPYMLSDGQTLYFAQDGENSLGGLDIFVTIYNTELEEYMRPQNVGMPFNSPYNDFMMAIDETIGVGWFVTDRNHSPGMLTLYLFIPNATKQVYQDCDTDTLISLAKLEKIADTWRDGEDYSQLLDAISNLQHSNEEDIMTDFSFVLCNGIIYTQSTHFKNRDALQYYNQSCIARKNIEELQMELSEMRKLYNEGNETVRNQLSDMILERENRLLKMQSLPYIYENRARRAELSFLNMLDD